MLRHLAIVELVLLLGCGGCADAYSRSADAEGARIQREKEREVQAFRRDRLVSPSATSPSKKPEQKGASVPPVVSLGEALRIATAQNRDYKTRRESLLLTALSLGLARRDFGGAPVPTGSLSYIFSGDSFNGDKQSTTSANLGATYLVPVTGAQLSATGNVASVNTPPGAGQVPVLVAGGLLVLSPGTPDTATLGGSVSLRQPLLKGAGSAAFETLTQAEHDMLYAARDFEVFRQTFALDVVQQYYGLVGQKQRVANSRRSTDALEFVARRAKAFFDVDRLTKIEELRTEQAYLRAKSGLLDEEQSMKLALDRFKIFLGVPTSTLFDVPENATPTFVPVDLELDAAVRAALANRLDLATARDQAADAERQAGVARNRLLPDISLVASYGITNAPGTGFQNLAYKDDSYSAGVTVELPLDRKSERNAYRQALIQVDRSRRSLRQLEDTVIVEIRDSLRRLRQAEEQIRIQREVIETERASVQYAEIQFQAGEVQTRDVTEAQQRLLEAENALLQTVIGYEVQRLGLLQKLGVLFVSEEGTVRR